MPSGSGAVRCAELRVNQCSRLRHALKESQKTLILVGPGGHGHTARPRRLHCMQQSHGRHRASHSRNLQQEKHKDHAGAAAHAELFAVRPSAPPPGFEQAALSQVRIPSARSAEEWRKARGRDTPVGASAPSRPTRAGSRRHVQRCQASCRCQAVPCPQRADGRLLMLAAAVCAHPYYTAFFVRRTQDVMALAVAHRRRTTRRQRWAATRRGRLFSFDQRKGPRTCSEKLGRPFVSFATISRCTREGRVK